ncbi:100K [Bovine adenovirus 7]|nr:100K [Bovine adenovirus 7]URN46035.1 100K [Bovine adenovirus 7]
MAGKNMGESEKGSEPHEPNSILSKHLERQIKICQTLNPTLEDLNIGSMLEKFLFCPKERRESGEPDPKLNFYPPFLIPECLALHYPFFLSTTIPPSCKINRLGCDTYTEWFSLQNLQFKVPELEKCKWDDKLGKVNLIEELKQNQKIVLIKEDTARTSWVKTKCKNLQHFSYPSLNLPPVLQQILLETFVGKIQDPNNLKTTYEPAITSQTLEKYNINVDLKALQNRLVLASTYGVLLQCMKKFFFNNQFIINCQETLHYTFNHGYVRFLNQLANVNLSEFVTFHGITHRNRLNNPFQHTQLGIEDKIDYIIDCIYLFLVLTWQTAMDIWNQTLDDNTINEIKKQLHSKTYEILKSESAEEASQIITCEIFPDILIEAFTRNLPDFINQAQLTNFRTFICSKSGIPQSICPLLPSDLIPLKFEEANPVLWSHVLLVQCASFLMNHGDYLHEIDQPQTLSSVYCDCNLCSPHRMPCYNSRLLQEILTIDKFEFVNADQSKSLKLNLQTFANAYLTKFNKDDFFFNKIKFYKDNKTHFSHQLTACVLKDEKLLAKLSEIQNRREKELLKRGKGIYLDPDTGETLSHNGEILPAHIEEQGERTCNAVSSSEQVKRLGRQTSERRRGRRRSE